VASILGHSAPFNTTAGNKTGASVAAAVGDLMVVVAIASGTSGANANTTAVTDANVDGLGVYTAVYDSGATSPRTRIYVRNSLIGNVAAFTVTATQASSNGGGFQAFKVTGMTLTGASAVRQTAGPTAVAAAGTPTFTFGVVPQTTNPIIGAVTAANTSTTALTPPTGFTEQNELIYSTPATSGEWVRDDSGNTAATVTWGSTNPTAGHVTGLELDASAFGIEMIAADPFSAGE
jgi:hypothetical protein